jgi:predicted glycosyltransferase
MTGVHMVEKRRSPQGYRMRAEMLRTLAEMDDHSSNRRMLLQIADDYDRMAETIEAAEQRDMLRRRTN